VGYGWPIGLPPSSIPAAEGIFSREAVTKILCERLEAAGYQAKDYAGHSFRKGAAQDAVDHGLPKQDIQLLGRWKSDAVKLYYQMDPSRIYALSYQHRSGVAPPFAFPRTIGLPSVAHSTLIRPPWPALWPIHFANLRLLSAL
jgi:hypothetical protein